MEEKKVSVASDQLLRNRNALFRVLAVAGDRYLREHRVYYLIQRLFPGPSTVTSHFPLVEMACRLLSFDRFVVFVLVRCVLLENLSFNCRHCHALLIQSSPLSLH